MGEAGSRRLRILIAGVNLGWALWALVGGIYYLLGGLTLAGDTSWFIGGRTVTAYGIVGWSLILSGVVSLISVPVRELAKVSALVSAAWCVSVAVGLQFVTPAVDHGEVYAWLLLMLAFTCVMRWALLTLEPHIGA